MGSLPPCGPDVRPRLTLSALARRPPSRVDPLTPDLPVYPQTYIEHPAPPPDRDHDVHLGSRPTGTPRARPQSSGPTHSPRPGHDAPRSRACDSHRLAFPELLLPHLEVKAVPLIANVHLLVLYLKHAILFQDARDADRNRDPGIAPGHLRCPRERLRTLAPRSSRGAASQATDSLTSSRLRTIGFSCAVHGRRTSAWSTSCSARIRCSTDAARYSSRGMPPHEIMSTGYLDRFHALSSRLKVSWSMGSANF